MKTNSNETVTERTENGFDKYPVFRGSKKSQLVPHTVREIEDPEWYALVMASLTVEISDDMTEEVSE